MRVLVPIVVPEAGPEGSAALIISDAHAFEQVQAAIWRLVAASGSSPAPDLIDLLAAQVLGLYAKAASEWQERVGSLSPAGHVCVVKVGDATFILGTPHALAGALTMNPTSALDGFLARHTRD